MNKTLPSWEPSSDFMKDSNMYNFMQWCNQKHQMNCETYSDFWQWSTTELESFWQSIVHFFELNYEGNIIPILQQKQKMIDTEWFPNLSLNYAENVFKEALSTSPAIVFKDENSDVIEITWQSLRQQCANIAKQFKALGLKKGDRVVGLLSNTPDAVIAFLAANSIGAIWSCCSPDFGTKSIIDRFEQIEPHIFIAVNGYQYNGRLYDTTEAVSKIKNSIKSIKHTIVIDSIATDSKIEGALKWEDLISQKAKSLTFEKVVFNHPIWVLYSSGTTGKPKAITHSTGGIITEHLKALSLHHNVKNGDRFFWYSTTGWMMWNYATSALLCGSTLAIFNGSPAYPTADALWKFAEEANITHFGAGAGYYNYCLKGGIDLSDNVALKRIQSFGATGSPLTADSFQWIKEKVNPNGWIVSLSGGTDICSGFVGGSPLLPVYEGEIQCRMLGVQLKAYNEEGVAIQNELGEMVIEKPMPSMPIYFWNDKDKIRYNESYYSMYTDVWRHGDWIKVTSNDTIIIYGRSDATLNRGGIRIGTSEIYTAAESVEEVKDALVVCIDYEDGSQYMPLFIQLKPGFELNMDVKKKVKKAIKSQFSPRHLPDKIFEVSAIPYTISGKKMETPIKKILSGVPVEKAATKDAMRNPEVLGEFAQFKK